jgi:TolB-like protein
MKFKINFFVFIFFLFSIFIISSEEIIKRISILPLINNTQEKNFDWISMCIPDMIISDFTKFNYFEVIERKDLNTIFQEQKITNSDEFDDDQAIEIGKLYSSTHILTGNYYKIDDKIRIDLKILNAETGIILHSSGISTTSDDLLTSEKFLVNDLLKNMGYDLSDSDKTNLYQMPTNKIKAVESYYKGVIAENEKNMIIALDSYENAKTFDPNYIDASNSFNNTNKSITTGSIFSNAKNEIEEKKNQIKILNDLNEYIKKNLYVFQVKNTPILGETDLDSNTAQINFELSINYNKKVLDMLEKVLSSISKRNKGDYNLNLKFKKGKVVKEINLKLYKESYGLLNDFIYGVKLYLIDVNNDPQGEVYFSIFRGNKSDSSRSSIFGDETELTLGCYEKLDYYSQSGRNSVRIDATYENSKKSDKLYVSFNNIDIDTIDKIKEVKIIQINAWPVPFNGHNRIEAFSFDEDIIMND